MLKEFCFALFRDGTFFELTGADIIDFHFAEGGNFHLTFYERGEIFGTFKKIILNEKIILIWNVKGFGRQPEMNTNVEITFQGESKTVITVRHSGILSRESIRAKEKAWNEILDDLQKKSLPA